MVWMASAATDTGIDTVSPLTDYLNIDKEDAVVFKPIVPCRILDTRTGNVPGSDPAVAYQRGVANLEIGPVGSGATRTQEFNDITIPVDYDARNITKTFSSRTVNVMGDCGGTGTQITHSSPVAVVVNVTVLNVETASYVTLYPWVQTYTTESDNTGLRPYVSHLNPYSSQPPVPNSVTVSLSNINAIGAQVPDLDGYQGFKIYNDMGRVNILVDVVGYYYSQQVVADITGSAGSSGS
jgi:hypothetical protein